MQRNKLDDWNDIMEAYRKDPQMATNHLVLGFDIHQRQKARLKHGDNVCHNWV